MVDKIQEAKSLTYQNVSQRVSQTNSIHPSSSREEKNNANAPKGTANEKVFKDLTKKLEDLKKIVKTSFKYEILKKPHMIIIKVINDEDHEVIRQIPPKEAVKLAKAIEALLGLFVDKHV